MSPRVRQTPGTARYAAYDLDSRQVLRGAAPAKSAFSTFCYVNTDTFGGIGTTVMPGSEVIDWGILGGTMGTKCAGLSPIVTHLDFAYTTDSLDPSLGGPGADLTLTFYTGYQGFAQDSGNCPVATFAFTGLPGTTGASSFGQNYVISVDLTGGDEFCLPDGRFGFGYRSNGDSGPVLCLSDGAAACTGNDGHLDIWVPDTKGLGSTLFFFSPPFIGSFYLRVGRADLSAVPASAVVRNAVPNPANSLACTAPVLGDTLTATVTAPLGYLSAFCFAFDSPTQIALGGGQVLLCLDLGGQGELLSGAGLPAAPIAPGAGGEPRFELEVPIPKNVDFCGFTFCLQALCAFGVTPFALTSACDLTVGG